MWTIQGYQGAMTHPHRPYLFAKAPPWARSGCRRFWLLRPRVRPSSERVLPWYPGSGWPRPPPATDAGRSRWDPLKNGVALSLNIPQKKGGNMAIRKWGEDGFFSLLCDLLSFRAIIYCRYNGLAFHMTCADFRFSPTNWRCYGHVWYSPSFATQQQVPGFQGFRAPKSDFYAGRKTSHHSQT